MLLRRRNVGRWFAGNKANSAVLAFISFAVFWSLKREGVKGAEEAARRVAAALEEHPHWRRSERGEREVRRILYKALLGAGAERITELAEHLMGTLRKASS